LNASPSSHCVTGAAGGPVFWPVHTARRDAARLSSCVVSGGVNLLLRQTVFVPGLRQPRAVGRGLETAEGAPAPAGDHVHVVGGTDQRRVDPARRRTFGRRRCGLRRPAAASRRPRAGHLLPVRLHLRAGRQPPVARGRVESGPCSQPDVLRRRRRRTAAWWPRCRRQTAVQRSARSRRQGQETADSTAAAAAAEQGLAAVELRDGNSLQTLNFRYPTLCTPFYPLN